MEMVLDNSSSPLRTVVIIQARMGSTRLPGKVLKTVNGRPLLSYQIERIKRCHEVNDIVIATTTNPQDQVIVELAEREGVQIFRGSEDDVLDRYFKAAQQAKADIVVRSTSDCPLVDPAVIDRAVVLLKSRFPNIDYVSNALKRTYPRGMDVEVFSFNALKKAAEETQNPYDREHVTPYLYQNLEKFKCENFTYSSDQSQHRWTVDTPEDFELVSLLLGALYPTNPQFTLEDLLKTIQRHPEWSRINAHVQQKTT